MKQASEALRNPVHVRDVLRSTDRSMSQLEGLGGGAFDVLRQMCVDIRRPCIGNYPDKFLGKTSEKMEEIKKNWPRQQKGHSIGGSASVAMTPYDHASFSVGA